MSVRRALYIANTLFSICLLTAPLAPAADFSNSEATSGLKEALSKEANQAVGQLGVDGGFLDNAEVKIPLPDKLKRAGELARNLGMGKQVDAVEQTMNHAAEQAVHQATPILLDAVTKMHWDDARGIVTGGNTAATDFFRRTCSDALTQRFQPIVHAATSQLKLTDKYNQLAQAGAMLGLVKAEDADLDGYVTRKALDGLFLMMSKEEIAIRQDPAGQASKLLRKLFGGS